MLEYFELLSNGCKEEWPEGCQATLKSVKKEPDSQEKASSGPSVDKAAQQGFINSIKYRANTKNDPDAQTLLEA